MEYLTIWLYVVAALRLLSVGIGYTRPLTLAKRVFPTPASAQVTPLMGRTFGIWTLVTCTLCVLCAQEPDPNASIFLATFLSFVYAGGYFVLELVVYKTVTVKSVLSPAVVAGTSVVWMGALLLGVKF